MEQGRFFSMSTEKKRGAIIRGRAKIRDNTVCYPFIDLPRTAFLFCPSPLSVIIYSATYWLICMELHCYFLLYQPVMLFIFFVVDVFCRRIYLAVTPYFFIFFPPILSLFFFLCRLRSSQSVSPYYE